MIAADAGSPSPAETSSASSNGSNGSNGASTAPAPVSSPAGDAISQTPAPVVIPAAPAAPAKVKVSDDTVFTGELLRQVRESQRITLKEIAERTRISVANLSALESERYEDLPNARVYVRGFVRCLAVEIGLDRDHVSRTYVPRWEAWFADQNLRGVR